jgi:hypothetical protein
LHQNKHSAFLPINYPARSKRSGLLPPSHYRSHSQSTSTTNTQLHSPTLWPHLRPKCQFNHQSTAWHKIWEYVVVYNIEDRVNTRDWILYVLLPVV